MLTTRFPQAVLNSAGLFDAVVLEVISTSVMTATTLRISKSVLENSKSLSTFFRLFAQNSFKFLIPLVLEVQVTKFIYFFQ